MARDDTGRMTAVGCLADAGAMLLLLRAIAWRPG